MKVICVDDEQPALDTFRSKAKGFPEIESLGLLVGNPVFRVEQDRRSLFGHRDAGYGRHLACEGVKEKGLQHQDIFYDGF